MINFIKMFRYKEETFDPKITTSIKGSDYWGEGHAILAFLKSTGELVEFYTGSISYKCDDASKTFKPHAYIYRVYNPAHNERWSNGSFPRTETSGKAVPMSDLVFTKNTNMYDDIQYNVEIHHGNSGEIANIVMCLENALIFRNYFSHRDFRYKNIYISKDAINKVVFKPKFGKNSFELSEGTGEFILKSNLQLNEYLNDLLV